MDTNSTIAWILVGVVVIIFLLALYYISQLKKRKSKKIITEPEFKAAKIEAPKVEVPDVSLKPEFKAAKIEAPKVEVPDVSLKPEFKAAKIEAPKVEVPDVSLKPEFKAAKIEAPKKIDAVKLATENKSKSTTVDIETRRLEQEKIAREQIISQRPRKSKELVIRKDRGKNILDIEGIGPVYAEKLRSVNIFTTSDILESSATPRDRKELSDKTGISPSLILEWANLSDLFRIKGVGEEYSDLLEVAGVDTVVELSRRNAANLHAKILEVNEAKKLVRRPPSLASIENWVQEAKTLPRIIEY